jgi:hypothetical protein
MERRYHIFWPLVFIATGVLWILIEMGRIPVPNLWALTYLWPLALIGAGVGLILRPYWRYAGVLMSVLVVGSLFLGVLFADQLGWNRAPVQGFNSALSFAIPSAKGSGHVVTETRAVHDFTAVHVNYPASVTIKQGTTESLTIQAEDNVAASIKTQVVNHVLEIENVQDHALYIAPTKPVLITLVAKDLSQLDFNSAGEVNVQGLKTKALEATLDGAGNMKLLDLQLDTLDARLSGVGSMEASGTAKTLTVQVDGVGSFDGSKLKTQDATVSLNGLGNASVWADDTLTATVNGLGSVSYSGSAQVTKSVSGLGSVKFTGNK